MRRAPSAERIHDASAESFVAILVQLRAASAIESRGDGGADAFRAQAERLAECGLARLRRRRDCALLGEPAGPTLHGALARLVEWADAHVLGSCALLDLRRATSIEGEAAVEAHDFALTVVVALVEHARAESIVVVLDGDGRKLHVAVLGVLSPTGSESWSVSLPRLESRLSGRSAIVTDLSDDRLEIRVSASFG